MTTWVATLAKRRNDKDYFISTDKELLDIEVLYRFLTRAYWSEGRARQTILNSIEHCLCFGVYHGDEQVGFARVLTDYEIFAYLMDVFIIEEHRGKGLSKRLLGSIIEHPQLSGIKKWMLATKDAHGLYQQFGFKPVADASILMEYLRNPEKR